MSPEKKEQQKQDKKNRKKEFKDMLTKHITVMAYENSKMHDLLIKIHVQGYRQYSAYALVDRLAAAAPASQKDRVNFLQESFPRKAGNAPKTSYAMLPIDISEILTNVDTALKHTPRPEPKVDKDLDKSIFPEFDRKALQEGLNKDKKVLIGLGVIAAAAFAGICAAAYQSKNTPPRGPKPPRKK